MRLNEKQIQEVLAIRDEDITKEFFILWFGKDESGKSKYEPNDSFMIKKGMTPSYKQNTPTLTTIGRFIFNKFINESIFGDTFDYFNGTNYIKFRDMIDEALVEGYVTTDQFSKYQSKICWLAYAPMEILVPGLSFGMMTPNAKVMARKKELFKKYEKQLAAGDIKIMAAIEKELLDLAKKENAKDPSLRLFNQKKPSFGNNYKTMCVMVGALADNDDPGKFHITGGNYIDGIPKDEMPYYADQLVSGIYSRSVSTQVPGAQAKEIQSALQCEKANKNPESDCHTKLYSTVTMTPNLIQTYSYKYMINDDGTYTELTPKILRTLIGKTIKVRSAIFCNDELYCAKCCGALFNKLGIENIGLTAADIAHKRMGLALKSMHDTSINVTEIDYKKYFYDFK